MGGYCPLKKPMTDFDLISTVQPDDGWYAMLGLRGSTKDLKQSLVATREEFDALVEKYVAEGYDCYFGVAKYEEGKGGRVKENVRALKSFFIDIDCGEAKAKENPKTGRPDGYIDQDAGLAALESFCELVGIPMPTLVNSGGGIHAYWALTEAVTRQQWEPVAARLRSLCNTHNFYVDNVNFEVARVLRVPDTYNFKYDPPAKVQALEFAPAVDFKEFSDILGVEDEPFERTEKKKRLTKLGQTLADSTEASFTKIMIRSDKGTGCAQLLDCYVSRETLSEPRWFNALSVAKFCSDKDKAIHLISSGHPDYDREEVERKIQHIAGPHSCEKFEINNPGGCDGCPHKGRFTGPIALGKELIVASPEDNIIVEEAENDEGEIFDTHHTVPSYPEPFYRGKGGGIWYMEPGDEAEPICIYENDLYVDRRMEDPVKGDVVILKLHLPKDGVREFTVTNMELTEPREVRKILASKGVICPGKKFDLLLRYLYMVIQDMQGQGSAERMRLQFGWADKDSKFIVGDREITKDGVFHSPPSSTTKHIAEHMQPCGTLEDWQEVFNLYNKEGLEGHAFAALTAFGAPLFKFLGQNGGIINVIHPSSGTGKTTILRMANSVFGDPDRLSANWSDTINAKIMRLGIMNNIAFTVDELTNTSPEDFSTLVYSMSQGRGKDRLMSSTNEMRANITSWATMSLGSSNASFYEKMTLKKNNPDGEMMRLLEYKIDYSDAIPADEAKHMFDHQLKNNYGHAGDIYAEWLVGNLEEAIDTALKIQRKIDKELRLTQRERFWSAFAAANLAGGLIATKSLGLIDYPMRRLYSWVITLITELKEQVAPPPQNMSMVLADYIHRNIHSTLVIDDKIDNRNGGMDNMQAAPIQEPTRGLLMRFEPDTKLLYVAAKPFKDDCITYQINYKELLQNLKDQGVYKETRNKRLSKGMKVASPAVHCLIFDCSNEDFLDVDSLVGADTEDGSGEG